MSNELKQNDFEWRQFCRLGEMIGDGLHLEADGKWITKEYRRLSKILLPQTPEQKEYRMAQRRLKAENINAQMSKLLDGKRCSCGGAIKQARSGAKVAYCESCQARYVAKSKKSKL